MSIANHLTGYAMNNTTLSLLLTAVLSPAALFGQITYTQTQETTLTIAGTSTLHDWTMTSTAATCQADFAFQADGSPAGLSRLVVSLPAESLKSHKDAMDKNAYKALRTDQFKTITYSMLTTNIQGPIIQTTGNLTINGTTRKIDLQATCQRFSEYTLHCTGKKELKMSDYKVEAPSFMFGTIKTGDAITLSFDVKLAKSSSPNATIK